MTWATRIVPALADLVDLLTDAGVKATTDRDKLPVPGAWVHPEKVVPLHTLTGDDDAARLRVSVLLVARDTGDASALQVLAGLLELVLEVLTPDEDPDLSVILPRPGESPLPAFRLTVDLDI